MNLIRFNAEYKLNLLMKSICKIFFFAKIKRFLLLFFVLRKKVEIQGNERRRRNALALSELQRSIYKQRTQDRGRGQRRGDTKRVEEGMGREDGE